MIYEKFASNFKSLLHPFDNQAFALAVSGGSDSIALLMLASEFIGNSKSQLKVFTVNHHLRPSANNETSYVHKLANQLGHECFQLDWDAEGNFSNMQARARRGRYELMTDLCFKLDILTLVTAHHFDDNLESFCLKLERKSSIFGLSAHNVGCYNNVRIIRPLFNFLKSDLTQYLNARGIQWCEDESNYSLKYKRNEIRQKLQTWPEIGNDLRIIHQEIDDFAANLTLDFQEAISNAVIFSLHGYAIINLELFKTFIPVIKFQLLVHCLSIISGRNESPRRLSVMQILQEVNDNCLINKNIHGCNLILNSGNLLVIRDFGRKLPQILRASTKNLWDERFQIIINSIPRDELFIANLTQADYAHIKKWLNKYFQIDYKMASKYTKKILFTLPVLKTLEKVIAIPNINYYNNPDEKQNISCYFKSNFKSRFTHFI